MAALMAVIATLTTVCFIGVVILSIVEYKRDRGSKKNVQHRKK